MKKKLEKFGDLRRGRDVKLNSCILVPRKGKDFAEVVFFGDLHLGHPNSLIDKAKGYLDYCLENRSHVLLMGDLIECGIIGSIGDSVYAQKLNPQGQVEEIIDLLLPLADAGLILGIHTGNHEERIFKSSGVNVSKMIAGTLRVPYLHSACWNIFKVGSQNYTVYSMHGSSGSRFIYTKLKSATDVSHYFLADIVAMGHVHDLGAITFERQRVDLRNKQIEHRKFHVILTGHYLGYQLSYAQAKGMPPSKVGSPKVKFYINKHDTHVSQ